ncbi:MAG: hypothetical protein JO323_11570 [Acidobacteriia bacterium]|nr:hypothetical protein [Terriglobia bacterium]
MKSLVLSLLILAGMLSAGDKKLSPGLKSGLSNIPASWTTASLFSETNSANVANSASHAIAAITGIAPGTVLHATLRILPENAPAAFADISAALWKAFMVADLSTYANSIAWGERMTQGFNAIWSSSIAWGLNSAVSESVRRFAEQ